MSNKSEKDRPKWTGQIVYMVAIYLLVVFHIICDVASLSFIQVLQGNVSDFELSALRLGLQLPITYIMVKCQGKTVLLKLTNFKWIIIASIGFLGFNIGYFGASKCMPLALLGSGHRFGIAITIVLLVFVLQNKPPGKANIIAIILCVIGITMMIQPRFVFHQDNPPMNTLVHSLNSTLDMATLEKGSETIPPNCFALLTVGILGSSLYMYSIGHALLDLPLSVQLFWIYLFSLGGCVALSFYVYPVNIRFLLNLRESLLVFATAILANISVLSGMPALCAIGALRFNICMIFTIPTQLFSQYMFLQNYQPGSHNVLEVIGTLIVTVGIVMPPAFDCYTEGKKEELGDQ